MTTVGSHQDRAALRRLPSVDRLAGDLVSAGLARTVREAIGPSRAVIEERRSELLAGAAADAAGGVDGEAPAGGSMADDPASGLLARAAALLEASPRRVLNATGVVVHTNLGRAPLADAARAAVADAAAGYVDLELDLGSGKRGGRDEHCARLLRELTGAEDALVVNNGAAATLLAVAALGGEGGVAVSRGELIEIGGGFRVPEVVAQAGRALVEVGTTNRTHAADFQRAVDGGATAILRVHQANFRTVGFTAAAALSDLTALGVPVVDDLGSGALAAAELEVLADEPDVRASIAAGVDVACFSGDKLLGGPQAGILVGTAAAIDACRRHPLARALRAGRLVVAALSATLALYRDPARALREIPVLRMLGAHPDDLAARARRLAEATGGEVVRAEARVGGGALPLTSLPGPAVRLTPPDGDADGLAARLRAADPPVVGRIERGDVLLDPRTLEPHEIELVARAAAAALAAAGERPR